MYLICTVIIIVSLTSALPAQPYQPTLTIPNGVLQGDIGITVNMNPFYKFEGIPYAKPPVNDLRFEPPEDIEPWEGIWKATTQTRCMQYDHYRQDSDDNYVVHGDEDCLYVNVYTHMLGEGANMDVLVFIHGGAFMFGSGFSYGPEIIMDRKVVFVTFNYRLGPLGFLSTEDEELPGNLGLRDQIKALQWVKENIQYFGGNPESITIFGLSAGGASVHFHYLSPESTGLFKAGISQSGCMLNPWVLAEHSKQKTARLADLIGCPTGSSREIVQCLKTKPAAEIVGAVKFFLNFLYNPFSPFGIVVDGYWSKNPVLPDHPYKLLLEGKVQDLPWLISHTTAEGLYPAFDFYSNDQHLIDIDTKWNEIIPFVLHYNESVEPRLKDDVSRQIREHYLGENHVTIDTYNTLVKLIGDRLFLSDIETSARLQSIATESDVFSYAYSYRGAVSKSNPRTGSNVDIGCSHGDDTIYILKTDLDTLSTDQDKQMSQIFVDLITSFMNKTVPNITEWKPVSKTPEAEFAQLKIDGPTETAMVYRTEIGERSFWHSLPFRENHFLDVIIDKDEL
ncbi:venom carboxylesterase-6-like isoform X1 [Rhynchophorus ferrugineus]|uniref:venom carboxylesterase-6-like isoform X1 n=1 Tax=Rhynchophorus ferrugineus TaxID=354439 RepID=UPI003FCD3D47